MTAPLDKLHDFYQPPPPAWAPQTIGWYVLFTMAGLVVIWLTFRGIRRRLANRYRREALRELATLPADQFSTLLKRTALAAWPRVSVASLSGEAWLSFLSETSGSNLFHRAPGSSIEEVALRPGVLSAEDEQRLRALAGEWIRRHRVQT
jgi:hypothetical protein